MEIGDIDNSQGQLIKFDVKASTTGVNVQEAGSIAKAISKSPQVDRAADAVSDVWKAITYGPRTGEVTFNDTYADSLPSELKNACPTRRMTGLMVIRETNKYPVVSGEIVRISGYCIHPLTQQRTH